jgi:hypothetical protein
VQGSQGAQRAIMMMNPLALQADTEAFLEECRLSRERNGNCGLYSAESK